MTDEEKLRSINVIDEVETDGEMFLVTDEGSWSYDNVWFADWKDANAMMYGAVQAAKRGGEVVLLNNQSDTYIIASTADKVQR